MRILVVIPLNEDEKERLQAKMPEAEYIFISNKEISDEIVKSADIIIGNVPPEYINGSKKLKWLQLNSAGTDGYCEAGVIPEGAYLTNASGAYGLAISEHMLGMLLEIKKKLNLYYINQKKHLWKDEGNVTSIEGSTTLVVGLGNIGGDFARKMKALGSYTIGIKRTKGQKPEYIDELYTMEALDELLPKADIVALSLPGTKDTYHLFNKDKFNLMRKDAIILNVGRGNCVCTEDLCDALENGVIGGAGLDVTQPEPLPSEHRLWDAPGVVITPHISGFFHLPETLRRIVNISIENLEYFKNQQPLKNIVDFKTGYRVNKKKV
ncbi:MULTISPECIES: D-2-hydroxyacid dehydrogenase [Clostridium]|uniref:2-hydroxyacid dehydrogenase n=2 Tax=Clostridium TaxID=1485 RepID=D8GPW9_CLOLD|nr:MULTISPECIES: D-2-hydroxyacid dehydrogenase [Clostridium]ADK16060.1 phosphoglycerate dehydrogenase related protein [Clostridium ljungdahlii DSM 13528]AGY75237.1 D-2-hydroxyacid dehydrogenase [Clostridium autoethanogenum DSM 10061]ALU35406.1 Glyoxylate reductase (NADP(+)) [Clostridium autoethanogenum DSM 10061]OAA87064.1 putative 2-hydroxyacid dehydrogenase [Clostridium ljungdahlii DSM 13528]OVY49515.1 putative 2-hydroxyacid dehydrogenase [Clostridium autoethanogenum]